MSSTALVVDTVVLRNASNNLTSISNEFGEAGNKAKSVANLIGTSGAARDLASAIADFANTWDDRRAKLRKNIDALAKSTLQIATDFEAKDNELKNALPNVSGGTRTVLSGTSGVMNGVSAIKQATSTGNISSATEPSPVYSVVGDAQKAYDSVHAERESVTAQITALEQQLGVTCQPGVWGQIAATVTGIATKVVMDQIAQLKAREAVLVQKEASLAKDVKREEAFSSWKLSVGEIGPNYKEPQHESVIEVGDGPYAQCVDVVKNYAATLFGSYEQAFPFDAGRFNGNQAYARGSNEYFQKLPPSALPQPGDILSFGNGINHTSVVDHIDLNGVVWTIDQAGSEESHRQWGVGPFYSSNDPKSSNWAKHCLGILRPNPDMIIR